jgi:hypothetical protein
MLAQLPKPTNKMLLYIGIGVVVLITIIVITIVSRNAAKVSSPSTVKKVIRDRVALLNAAIEPTAGKKKSIYEMPLPEDQALLLNYQPISCRLAGYLDPLQDGVFAEADAVRLGLAAGARLFVLEISRGADGRPSLVARDSMGYKRSLNEGSIRKVCESLVNKTDDPVVLALYIHSAPDKTKNPEEYLSFLSHIAKGLEPLIPYHIGLTSVGDFTRQKKENELFTFSPNFYKGKIVVLCNADTSGFRDPARLGVKRTFSPKEDLDFFVHARLYKAEGGGELGITEVATGSAKVQLVSDSYFLLTPPDKIAAAVNTTRNTFTIIMKKDPTFTPTDKVTDLLYKTYGVQSIPLQLDVLASRSATATWTPKDISLRFVKPKPIIPTVPNPQLNANGGVVVAPKL